MIKLKLVGYEKVEYTKKDRTEVSGHKLHVMYDDDEYENSEAVTGKAVEAIYIGNSVAVPALKIGDNIQIHFNRFGRVTKVKSVAV